MYDYHNHSNFSDDGNVPMEEMVQAAYEKGLDEIAITDHYDPNYPDPAFPFALDFENYHKTLEKTKAQFQGKIKVIKGIEIGIQHGDTLTLCSQAATDYPYDFIIGSFHCAQGCELYGNGYFAERSVEDAYVIFYEYMHHCLKNYHHYDVLGHFNIIDRYTTRIPDGKQYMDVVEDILKLIIDQGKGLEINTSSFRYGMKHRTTPTLEMLQLYKDLGGEIITTGSDAHQPIHIMEKLDYAQSMIKSVGLNYVTTFEQRQPKFHKLY
ncbi:MAG: histidinol-phosphatase HisJ family protein [Anaerovorax sp.]